jgi:hypothetical protein
MCKGGFSTNDVKKVFRLYDWQKKAHEQDPAILDKIEVLLGLKDAPWNGPNTRAVILNEKVYMVLSEVMMKRLGWIAGSPYREEDTGKMRMYFRPADPKKKKVASLPWWLPMDLLNLNPDPFLSFKHFRLDNGQDE